MSDVTKLTDAVSDKARLAIRQRLLNTMDLHKNVLVTQVILDIMKEELDKIKGEPKLEAKRPSISQLRELEKFELEEDEDDQRSSSCD